MATGSLVGKVAGASNTAEANSLVCSGCGSAGFTATVRTLLPDSTGNTDVVSQLRQAGAQNIPNPKPWPEKPADLKTYR